MKRYCLLIAVFILSCAQDPSTYIEHLEGYWEIKEVTLNNGIKKQYQYNETIDYIKINDGLEGFRKKLKPGINDTYFTSDDAEALTLSNEDGKLIMHYSTLYAEWTETVLEASPENLRVKNEDNTVYLYKRYSPIKLDIE